MKERLIELIGDVLDDCASMDCYECSYEVGNSCKAKMIAGYLLDNGVIVLPCKVGDTVWKIATQRDNYDDHEYKIVMSSSFRLDFLPAMGKTIFLTKEEAEARLKELEVQGDTR